MKFRILVVAILWSLIFASDACARPMASLGTAMNFQLAANGRDYESRTPISIRGGYRFKYFDLFAEYSFDSVSPTGPQMIQVGTDTKELILWARKSFAASQRIKPFLGLGFGAHQTTVKTVFDGASYRDNGQPEALGAGSAGILLRLHRNFDIAVEGRASAVASYTQPQLGLGAFLSYLF